MRNMLVRAAEVRESEQQQVFDALDDIYARLSPVESLGAVRKRLSELPDRTEVGVLAERIDETMSRLEAQDKAMAAIARAVDGIVDKLAKPFAELGGRLDGVAGKFEGVAGRMDGLEDKLQNIHRRLDELEMHLDKQDSRLESVPSAVHGPVRERVDTAEAALRERIDALEADAKQRATESEAAYRDQLASAQETLREQLRDATTKLDASETLSSITDKVEMLGVSLEELESRINKVEEGMSTRFGDLDGVVKARIAGVEGILGDRPDSDAVNSIVRKSNEESERRIGGQLDEAMATFAELMLGGGPQQVTQPTPPPRQPRRTRSNNRARNGTKKEDTADVSGD
ncbi:PA containing protein [Haloechinothrix salitolerans]|uniref:PA containing protein n=1 Tax=Haloechinothrix salitolerans TaxID=926830 RepID=A0ABW2C7V9_9PSEU